MNTPSKYLDNHNIFKSIFTNNKLSARQDYSNDKMEFQNDQDSISPHKGMFLILKKQNDNVDVFDEDDHNRSIPDQQFVQAEF